MTDPGPGPNGPGNPGPGRAHMPPARQYPLSPGAVCPVSAGGPGLTLPTFTEGEHRLVGRVWEPPMPGSPPGPPPDPGPPPKWPGLSWLPALALPSLLLLAAIDHVAWAAWWI